MPVSGDYARYLEILTNPGTARSVEVVVAGIVGDFSNPPSLVVAPGSTGRTYAVQEFATMGGLGFVLGSAAAPTPLLDAYIASDRTFYYAWNVTVPAGGTVILMHFSQQDSTSAAAAAHAQELAAMTRAGMLDGMSAQERAQVLNFKLQ